jgi:hypothetical protein
MQLFFLLQLLNLLQPFLCPLKEILKLYRLEFFLTLKAFAMASVTNAVERLLQDLS